MSYLELLLCVIPWPTESKKARRAKVTYSYVAENPDELNLQPGQVSALLMSPTPPFMVVNVIFTE